MTKTVLYEYLGTNGTLLTPIHLEDIYYTKDGKNKCVSVIIPEEELDEWKEV